MARNNRINTMRNLINETNGWVAKSQKEEKQNMHDEERNANAWQKPACGKSDNVSSKDEAVEQVPDQSVYPVSASNKDAASVPVSESDEATTTLGTEVQSSSAWDFFMSHCKSFDSNDPGISVRIDRKVKKRLDLAKAKMSETVSAKGMVSAIVMHFLMEHEVMFDQQEMP